MSQAARKPDGARALRLFLLLRSFVLFLSEVYPEQWRSERSIGAWKLTASGGARGRFGRRSAASARPDLQIVAVKRAVVSRSRFFNGRAAALRTSATGQRRTIKKPTGLSSSLRRRETDSSLVSRVRFSARNARPSPSVASTRARTGLSIIDQIRPADAKKCRKVRQGRASLLSPHDSPSPILHLTPGSHP